MDMSQLLEDFILGALLGDRESEDWALAMLGPWLGAEAGQAEETAAAYLGPYVNSLGMLDPEVGALPMMEGLVPTSAGTRPQLAPGGGGQGVLDMLGAPSRAHLYDQAKEHADARDRARLARRARPEQRQAIVPQQALDEASAIALDVVEALPGLPPGRRDLFLGMISHVSDRPADAVAWAGFAHSFGKQGLVDGRLKNWWEFTDPYNRATALLVWQGFPLSHARFLARQRARSRQQGAIWVEEMERAQTEEAPVGWAREAWRQPAVPYPVDPLGQMDTGPDELREKAGALGTLIGATSLIPGPHQLPAGIAGLGLALIAGSPDHRRVYTMSDAHRVPQQIGIVSEDLESWARPTELDEIRSAQQLHDWIADVGPARAARELSAAGWRWEAIDGVLRTHPNWGYPPISEDKILEVTRGLE